MEKMYIIKNYHNFISVPSEDDKKPIYFDEGELNTLTPFTRKLTFEQIEYINMRSDLFKTGRLEFEEKDEKEMFERLDIKEEEVYRASEILDIVKNPTQAKLERVVAITNLDTIDLFRGIVTSIKNLGNEDLSNRVITTVDKRRDEIYKGKILDTSIVIKKTKEEEKDEELEKEKQKAIADAVEKARIELEKEFQAKLDAMKVNNTAEKKVGRPSTKDK